MKSANREPRNFILTAIVVLSLFIPNCATAPSSSEGKPVSSSELVEIETRPGVTQKFILITPVDPVAAVVLFAAGRGKLGMAGFGGKPTLARSDNFLVRAREDFADHGLMVAVVDSPSDQQARGINSLFRISKEHVQDIEAVASYLKSKADLPVWLVGSGEGTFSAANGTINIKEKIDGLILAAGITRTPLSWRMHRTHPQGVIDMRLADIGVPVLVVWHSGDKCQLGSPADAPILKAGLTNSPSVEIRYFTGGKAPMSNECYPQSPHGFYGVEEQVVSAIAEFIKSSGK
ncbi:MAG: alpha/beta hydrolase [Deltaproteobacteria bacterium]|nr:MAG: alpha/beta hydrolase [Deltaproteobacteria bacterium]